jgi:hypothetical protein
MLVLTIPWLLLAPSPVLIGVILGLAVVIPPVTDSIVVGHRVALTPDRLQGRVQATSTAVSTSAMWLGPLTVGLLVQGAGSTAAILLLTAWSVVLTMTAVSSRAFRDPPRLLSAAELPDRDAEHQET